ncbi:MAG: hypothetical protein MI924_24960, partial [Chloroflexales bacterium]|nr:hypothetical protein [Chloroflexales bacterium]
DAGCSSCQYLRSGLKRGMEYGSHAVMHKRGLRTPRADAPVLHCHGDVSRGEELIFGEKANGVCSPKLEVIAVVCYKVMTVVFADDSCGASYVVH